MQTNDLPIRVTPDIADKLDDAKRRLLAGEPTTVQALADATGLDFEMLAAAMAIHTVLKQGISVTIDPADAPPLN